MSARVMLTSCRTVALRSWMKAASTVSPLSAAGVCVDLQVQWLELLAERSFVVDDGRAVSCAVVLVEDDVSAPTHMKPSRYSSDGDGS